jgi:hypothetical protein
VNIIIIKCVPVIVSPQNWYRLLWLPMSSLVPISSLYSWIRSEGRKIPYRPLRMRTCCCANMNSWVLRVRIYIYIYIYICIYIYIYIYAKVEIYLYMYVLYTYVHTNISILIHICIHMCHGWYIGPFYVYLRVLASKPL